MATQNKVIVAVGYMLRFNAAFDKLRELLKQVGLRGATCLSHEQHQCMYDQCSLSCRRLLACSTMRSSSGLKLPPGNVVAASECRCGLPVLAALQNPVQQHRCSACAWCNSSSLSSLTSV